jgi:hypothetical protein
LINLNCKKKKKTVGNASALDVDLFKRQKWENEVHLKPGA